MSKFFDYFKPEKSSGPDLTKCRTWIFTFRPTSVSSNNEREVTFDFWMSGAEMMKRLMRDSYIGGDADDGPFIIETVGVKEVRGVVEEDCSLTASETVAKHAAQ